MEVQHVIRQIHILPSTLDIVRGLPCFRIINGNDEIILNSEVLDVAFRNVAYMGDFLVEFESHKWEVRHPLE